MRSPGPQGHLLLVAKAPAPRQAKTRLGAEIGMRAAAAIAAACLRDTIAACTEGFGAARCYLALAGDLRDAVHGEALADTLTGWTVFPQRGKGFADRLVHAHEEMARRGAAPLVQIGMDTPQVTPSLLADALAELDAQDGHDAVLGPALDGGWWSLTLRDPWRASALRGVAMSTPLTGADTRRAFAAAGLTVGTTSMLRDVDTVADVEVVSLDAPGTHVARAWRELSRQRR